MSEGRGRPVSQADIVEAVQKALQGRIGSFALAPGSVGAGSAEHESRAGVQNAQYIYLPVSGEGVYDVPHSLGSVPVGVLLYKTRNPEGTAEDSHAHASIEPVSEEKWTATSARISVALIKGASLSRCTLVLKVEGA